MSVAQGTEVLYMRLCGNRRYRLVVGLQELFIHSQLDIPEAPVAQLPRCPVARWKAARI
jgi:hypothetical protein